MSIILSILEQKIVLKDPLQSSTEEGYRYGCKNNMCTAEKAIDGDLGTNSKTKYKPQGWWKTELETTAKIASIRLYLSRYQFNMGYLKGKNFPYKLT